MSQTPNTAGAQAKKGELRQSMSHLKQAFVSVAVFSFFINILMLVPPIFMLQMFDRVLSSGSIPTLVMLLVVAIGLLIVMGLLDWSRNRVLVRAGTRLDALLDKRLFDATFFRALRSPDSGSTQPLKDMVTLRQFMTGQGVFAFFDAPWTPIFILIIFLFHPLLGVLTLIGAIILFAMAYANEVITREPLGAANSEYIKESDYASSNLRNAEVLEAMGMTGRLRQRWQKMHQSVLSLQAIASDRSANLTAASKSLRMILQVGILATGAYLAVQNIITPGVMIAASIIMARALAPIDQAMHAWRGFIGARGAWDRLNKVLESTPAPSEHMKLPTPQGNVTVENIVVVPPGMRTPSLRGVKLDLKPGQALGVIGPSAAGKSSLARALVGVWPTYAGEVRIDGADIHNWDREQLGPHIGYLPQDIELFAGTIAENIARFGEVDSDKVVEAARKTGLHEMILRLPQGYDTAIGIQGGALSAGQRQRVGLARAVYGNPRFIVLDEPNSNLDEAGEQALTHTIQQLREEGCTVVIIAHRPSVLSAVDQILVLKDGQPAALGPRQEVLGRFTRPSGLSGPGGSNPASQS
ncbi:type I secretion system permease/ATPase [Ectothiorhodospira variabilis]|uniref:type I secretion system permease/ATPase n=1 Tax=Ectothiorhodospira variabilis TaxID=505694 RepID=UPI001EFA3706|nr:type I secretion system permease/ATPase [Ectothiorhodospira variabilis]MCG5496566.1 type I secretion system permease/ATPase [Ectothiorhodospira variabilis]